MTKLVDTILSPFAALMAADGALYWPHLVGFVLFGAGLWLLRPEMRKGRGILGFLFPPAIYRTASAQLDLRFFVVNTLIYASLIAPMVLTSAAVARVTLAGMVQMFGVPDAPFEGGWGAALIASAILCIAADFGFYVAHWLQHKVPVLWAFHKTHHAAEVLHPLTAFRAHPVDHLIDFTCMATAMGVATAALAYVFDANLAPATLVGVNVFVLIFRAAGSHLRHSHIWLDYGPHVSRVLVSPAMHQLHHSSANEHRDKNLGGMLAIWDAMFDSIVIPPSERQPLTLGLAHGESLRYRSIMALYLRPIEDLIAMTLKRPPRLPRLPRDRKPRPPAQVPPTRRPSQKRALRKNRRTNR